jgi:hypothetical protein
MHGAFLARTSQYVATERSARMFPGTPSLHSGAGMPINRLLKGSNLSAAEIETLNRAFDLALKKLGLVDRNDPITEMVAAKIMAVAQRGLRDPVEISETALKELRS